MPISSNDLDAWDAALSAAKASAAVATQAVERLEEAALAVGRDPFRDLPVDSDDHEVSKVIPVPAMFLRGAGMSGAVWNAVKQICARHGWAVVRDRRQAWHLARGRIPVVMIDFTDGVVTVGKVRAVYGEDQQPLLKRASAELGLLDLETPAGSQTLVEAIIEAIFQPAFSAAAASVESTIKK